MRNKRGEKAERMTSEVRNLRFIKIKIYSQDRLDTAFFLQTFITKIICYLLFLYTYS